MQKFIKYFVCSILFIIYLPFIIAGFVFNEAKQAFKGGVDVSEASSRVFGDWLHND